MEIIDFTNCKRVLGRAYNGANGKKIAVEYNNSVYMLKFPPSGNGKPTELSYTNSCISEHIANSIFNIIGINAQETILGTYIDNVGFISELQKAFYKKYISERYAKILLPAFEIVC